jgi:hypothetical protein
MATNTVQQFGVEGFFAFSPDSHDTVLAFQMPDSQPTVGGFS